MAPLPIDEALPRLIDAFNSSLNVVLSAPPGAGKTTRVPVALLNAGWLDGRKIIMLEPRRLAAVRAARFMAAQLGEEPGDTVGYRIRGESRTGNNTRIEVVTEGILTRFLHADAELPGIALVIFDEFHERSIHADLGLALTLDCQSHLRGDLRLLVMSATLDGLSLSRVLGDASVVRSEGRSYPVDIRYLSSPSGAVMEAAVAALVRRALSETEGDLLVFLPGRREISRVELMLGDGGLPDGVVIRLLHGEADAATQQAALSPAPDGSRKVILSTSIAETSLTIDGVRVVIDSGLSRVARFDPRRGMSGLVTVPVSVAAADQRCGRAGRQRPGVCYRLWTESRHAALPSFPVPEILSTDLAPLVLDLARWGSPEGAGLRFIDPPPGAHMAEARSLLESLGALAPAGSLTPHGRAMSDLPVHPRLAHMIIAAEGLGLASQACDIAALLEDRDIIRRGVDADIDISSRLRALEDGRDADEGVRRSVLVEARRLRAVAGVPAGLYERPADTARAGMVLALAYPERIARRRGDSPWRFQMVNGTGALLPESSLLGREEFLAIADVDGAGTEVRVFLAAPLGKTDLLGLFADRVVDEELLFWDPSVDAVVARRVHRLGALAIDEAPVRPDVDALRDAMVVGIIQMGLDALPWSREARSVRWRSEWLRKRDLVPRTWPDLSDSHLLGNLHGWLAPFLGGMSRREHLDGLDINAAVRSLFTGEQWRQLNRLAPESLVVPTGSRIRLDYSGDVPVLSVRLQEMFGQTDTPQVAGTKVMIHLLSPAGRPLAVTQDLRSFWTNAYREVRKEMRGRYPKHAWPENPIEAAPTKRAKRSSPP